MKYKQNPLYKEKDKILTELEDNYNPFIIDFF